MKLPVLIKKRIYLAGCFTVELHIDNRYARIPFLGKKSYGLCGAQTVKVGLINESTSEMYGYIFKGGYMNRITLIGSDIPYLFIEVEYFDYNPLCSGEDPFSCESVALL